MKKIVFLTLTLFSFLFASNAFGQSNLTWTFKDTYAKNQEAKTVNVLNAEFTGFKNSDEVSKFCKTLKTNFSFSSVDVISSNANSCDLKLTLKQPQDKNYYISIAQKMNVSYIVFNGEKKSTTDWAKQP